MKVEEVTAKIESRRSSYGPVLVKGAMIRKGDIWENVVTRILPLHKSESGVSTKKLNYGNLIFFEEIISLDDLVEAIRKLPERGSAITRFGSYEANVEVESLQNGYKYDSGEEYLSVGWFFEKYQFRSPSRNFPSEPIVCKDLPFFPDFRDAVNELLGIDLQRYSDSYGILLCLPRYGAKIEEVNVGSKEIRVRIQPRDVDAKNIVAKFYCSRGGEAKHADVEFKDNTGSASIGFNPDSLYITLVSKIDNEILDNRRYYSSWPALPKGVIIDLPEYELDELISHGETETVEFKEKIGKPEDLAQTAVAFANTQGGLILIGVDDNSKIVGFYEQGCEDTITNILRSHCDPELKYEVSKRQVQDKDIVIVEVKEGENKPYFVRDKGPYIRAHGTNRTASRYEIDEIYKQKSSEHRW